MNRLQAAWPHSVALLDLMLEKLHPLKLEMRPSWLETLYFCATWGAIREAKGAKKARCYFLRYSTPSNEVGQKTSFENRKIICKSFSLYIELSTLQRQDIWHSNFVSLQIFTHFDFDACNTFQRTEACLPLCNISFPFNNTNYWSFADGILYNCCDNSYSTVWRLHYPIFSLVPALCPLRSHTVVICGRPRRRHY